MVAFCWEDEEKTNGDWLKDKESSLCGALLKSNATLTFWSWIILAARTLGRSKRERDLGASHVLCKSHAKRSGIWKDLLWDSRFVRGLFHWRHTPWLLRTGTSVPSNLCMELHDEQAESHPEEVKRKLYVRSFSAWRTKDEKHVLNLKAQVISPSTQLARVPLHLMFASGYRPTKYANSRTSW